MERPPSPRTALVEAAASLRESSGKPRHTNNAAIIERTLTTLDARGDRRAAGAGVVDAEWAPLAARARAQAAALALLTRGVPLSGQLLEAVGGGGEAVSIFLLDGGTPFRRVFFFALTLHPPLPTQTAHLRAVLARSPRVINSAVADTAWPGVRVETPVRPPLTADDAAAARRSVADRERARLRALATDASRAAADVKAPHDARLASLLRAKAARLAPRQAALRAAVVADAEAAAALSDVSTLAEWTRWRVAAPWELAYPTHIPSGPRVTAADQDAAAASARAAAARSAPPSRRAAAAAAAAAARSEAGSARLAAALAAARAERAAWDARAAVAADAVAGLRGDGGLRSARAAADKRRLQRNNAARAWHGRMGRAIARDGAARVAALKGADYEGYVKLAAKAKDARLTELLSRTDAIVAALKARVPAQRAEAEAVRSAAASRRAAAAKREEDGDDDDDGPLAPPPHRRGPLLCPARARPRRPPPPRRGGRPGGRPSAGHPTRVLWRGARHSGGGGPTRAVDGGGTCAPTN